ncbi:hypothetical protein G3I19_30995 [Streptomyces sp. SID10853]|uniref:hypothetical protein n=1 Tax=Streptomyces sp. SID10853 TaxID=2706028 RepID=UPI0013C268EC|nr:hypothetical protein [Streptomyces sp. SID10853]NDZ82878.1 hypothetical protein [Streptomyces sp. SID10853]
MTPDNERQHGDPLPRLTAPRHTTHPVLAAVLAETRQRDPHEPLVAYYEDAP